MKTCRTLELSTNKHFPTLFAQKPSKLRRPPTSAKSLHHRLIGVLIPTVPPHCKNDNAFSSPYCHQEREKAAATMHYYRTLGRYNTELVIWCGRLCWRHDMMGGGARGRRPLLHMRAIARRNGNFLQQWDMAYGMHRMNGNTAVSCLPLGSH